MGEVAGSALGWLIGVVLAFAALGAMTTDFVGGLLFLLSAAVVLPPVNAWLKRSANIALSWKAKAWAVFALIIAGSLMMARNITRQEEQETAQAAAARSDALRTEYASGSAAILARIDSAYKARNYGLAVSIGDKYSGAVTDSALGRRLSDARAAQKRIADQAREQQLLSQVQAVPANNLQARRDLYQQLVAVAPSNASYKAKFDEANNRIRQNQAAEQDRIRRFGPVPQASAWDGTYREVKDYLQAVANDPDRLKMDACTSVYHVDKGWLVGCDYRGANAFGGIVRQSNWFIIRQGRVIEMLPASAYRP